MVLVDEASQILEIYSNPSEIENVLGTKIRETGRVGFGCTDLSKYEFINYIKGLEQYKLDGQKKFYENLLKQDLEAKIKQGFEIAKSVMPNQQYFEPSLVMLLDVPGTDAKVINDKWAGVNLTTLFYDTFYASKDKKNLDMEFAVDKIRSFAAHEGNHLYLRQVNYKRSSNWINEVLFSEGLATLIETEHLENHYEFVKENKFWMESLKNLNNSNFKEKVLILKSMAKSPALMKYNPKICKKINEISNNISNDEVNSILSSVLSKNNGPIYHVGYHMWKTIAEKLGKEKIKEIVKKGPDYFVKTFQKI